MPEPAIRNEGTQNLQEFVALAVRQVKMLHATLSAVMADVSAIRRTLLEEKDGLEEYQSNLISAIETAKPLVEEAMQSYDQMIDQLEENYQ